MCKKSILKYIIKVRFRCGYKSKNKLYGEGTTFIEDNYDRIYQLLYSLRTKRGTRGNNSLINEMHLLLLLGRGCNNRIISEELQCSLDAVKKIRKRLQNQLKKHLLEHSENYERNID